MESVTCRLLLTECTIWTEDAFFSRSGNFNRIWQLLRFQDNPVTVSGYKQGWGRGLQRQWFGGLWKLGGDVVMLELWSVSTNKFWGKEPAIVLLSVT